MASIYIHIPFCKQACHYCDFHFSTSTKKKAEMLLALSKELVMRKQECQDEPIETIYFGGGTPSVLDVSEINFLIATVYSHFKIVDNPEITLEANPDDLSFVKIKAFSETKINRLSIGVQSFFEDDLQLMNRAHNAKEAQESLTIATHYFDSISIDLIYGIPGLTDEKWLQNIEKALSFQVKHISSYALTVEPKTALDKFVKKGIIQAPSDIVAYNQFHILEKKLTQNGFIHYELSNFGKENYFSKNNSGYWLGKKYIGIGPSAHSFDGQVRSWNASNNAKYINSINLNILPSEKEVLSLSDRYNEYVMTGLRTIWGVSFLKIENDFGLKFLNYISKNAQKFCDRKQLILENNTLKATSDGKFFIDGIASELFWVD
jgi:oxygen-independent coproporphyrinogen-3 oxidase